MKIRINSHLYNSCGSCEDICPEVFRVTHDFVLNMLGRT